VLTGIGGPFSLLGGGVIFFTARRRLEEARLRRDGASAVGTVVAVKETNISINRIPQWRVHYTYKDVRGREHEGESALMTPDAAGRIAPGETAPVRYDRARPERSLWLGPPND
jgi:Protein of unknown function (DUF3592)